MITDANAFYGVYITKAHPVVHVSVSRKIENDLHEALRKENLAQGEIGRAHRMLDKLNAPRLQESGFPYSLEGRLTFLINKGNKQ
jgi:hypothetical protein